MSRLDEIREYHARYGDTRPGDDSWLLGHVAWLEGQRDEARAKAVRWYDEYAAETDTESFSAEWDDDIEKWRKP